MPDPDDEVVDAEIVPTTPSGQPIVDRTERQPQTLRDYLRTPGPKRQWDVEVVQKVRVRANNEVEAQQVALLLSQGEWALTVKPVDEEATRRNAFGEGAEGR